ncbi:MAG: RHS repeat-associated core domain-containing protein [Candidatus Magasanikbacteria bacterium]
MITDDQGEVTAEYEYDVFGSVVGKSGLAESSYLFTNQEFDSESELYYYNARYYNPAIGRFISRDPMLGRDGDVLSRNSYIYVKNNPLRYVDPTGEIEEECSLCTKDLYWEQGDKNFSDYAGNVADFFSDVADYNYQNGNWAQKAGGFISDMVGEMFDNVSIVTDPNSDRWEFTGAAFWLGLDVYTMGRGSAVKKGGQDAVVEILYHGTTKNRASNIVRNGFKIIDDIFTSKEFDTAIRFAEEKAAEVGANASAIVKVKIPTSIYQKLKSTGDIVEGAVEPFGSGMSETIFSPAAIEKLNNLNNVIESGVEYILTKIW